MVVEDRDVVLGAECLLNVGTLRLARQAEHGVTAKEDLLARSSHSSWERGWNRCMNVERCGQKGTHKPESCSRLAQQMPLAVLTTGSGLVIGPAT